MSDWHGPKISVTVIHKCHKETRHRVVVSHCNAVTVSRSCITVTLKISPRPKHANMAFFTVLMLAMFARKLHQLGMLQTNFKCRLPPFYNILGNNISIKNIFKNILSDPVCSI